MQSITISAETQNQQSRDDLQRFLTGLPASICALIEATGRQDELLELVMDVGRYPSARFIDGEQLLSESEVTHEEIESVVASIGEFDDDNRAGIARTLHRISGIRNRKGKVIGLTCRIGRAVYGTVDIIADIVAEGKSILLLGAPGVGKTTILREIARILSETRRVVIVDTSNEIGGDGDIPHAAVGRARRMQVPRPAQQHETMIEAVENHNPQVIIIDEIGREQEAIAARTINERGVQLIGTAHGRTLENLLLNPTLSDLVGGIESVTLSDEEARRRGTQKTVLERRSPPTFDVLIEMQARQELIVHRNVSESVDGLLRGWTFQIEKRWRDELGQIQLEMEESTASLASVISRRRGEAMGNSAESTTDNYTNGRSRSRSRDREEPATPATPSPALVAKAEQKKTVRIFSYGVARNRLYSAAQRLKINLQVVDALNEADLVITLKTYYRRQRHLMADAEQQRKPIYILRANTLNQMESVLADALGLGPISADPFEAAIEDAQRAIERIQAGESSIDLLPVGTAMRRYQHQMANQANLVSHSYGEEPDRHVRIFNMPRNESIPVLNS